MSYIEHKKQAETKKVTCAVITCSDTRKEEDDLSGHKIIDHLGKAGHEIEHYEIVKDEPAALRLVFKEMVRRVDIQAVIFNGGTGVSKRDNTFDTIAPLLTKVLPGFGELFRMLSYQAIGSPAMLSRAVAGVVLPEHRAGGVLVTDLNSDTRATLVFCIPGSPNAVDVAMEKLIVPELSHLVWETLR